MATRALRPSPATAQPPLATPTDLGSDEVRAVVEAVNPLIADSFALYVKTKNFHWHVSGPHFRDYHLLFDEQAEVVFESIDILAERVRKLGGSTIRSIGHVSNLQTLGDDEDEFVPPLEMVRRLLEDNRRMAEHQRAAIEVCDRNRDTATGNLLQEMLDQTERRVWFLFEVSQAGEPPVAERRPATAEGAPARGKASVRNAVRSPRRRGSRSEES
jgi:starvation-inducible DNA-binding protein